ncbi:HDOD domain-containing protein [Alteromonas sp. P256]|uniref:HDOD domain-containing protein n=1 Tax=Alteromonas sp. P256 TaxID=3117399 RepID=UPI002FE39672
MSSNQVVIVDDEELILKSLKRVLRRLAPSWSVHIFASPKEALDKLQQGEIQPDLVMCDRLMPGTRGDDVLLECRAHSPEAIRLLMTGDTRIDMKEIVASNVHIFISKPFEHGDISDVFNRVMRIKALPLKHSVRQALGRLKGLPVLNETYQKLDRLLKCEDAELDEVARVVGKDPTLVANVLQAANSPFLGFRGQVSSVDKAVKRLGLNTIASIAVASSLSQTYSIDSKMHRDVVVRALSSAYIATRLMQMRGFTREQAEYAFSMSLLASIGELYLVDAPETANDVGLKSSTKPISALITYYLLTIWGIEERLVEDILSASCAVESTLRSCKESEKPQESDNFEESKESKKAEGLIASQVFYLARRLACEDFDEALADVLKMDEFAQWYPALNALKENPPEDINLAVPQ